MKSWNTIICVVIKPEWILRNYRWSGGPHLHSPLCLPSNTGGEVESVWLVFCLQTVWGDRVLTSPDKILRSLQDVIIIESCKNYSIMKYFKLKYYKNYYKRLVSFQQRYNSIFFLYNRIYFDLWYKIATLSKKYRDKVEFLYNI